MPSPRSNTAEKLTLLPFRLYSLVISPMVHLVCGPGFGCRFEPSCSDYARDAVQEHGLIKGSVLSLRRISRCNPLGSHGLDPVPKRSI